MYVYYTLTDRQGKKEKRGIKSGNVFITCTEDEDDKPGIYSFRREEASQMRTNSLMFSVENVIYFILIHCKTSSANVVM